MEIHPTAIVHPGAKIGPGVKIGAYSLIGENVQIERDTVIGSHVVLEGWTEIGEGCQIFPFASVGAAPQAIRYRGEPTRLVIGKRNIIREFVTVNRGTPEGGGITSLGDGNLIMAYSHIAHDCRIGNQVILANSSTLAGHITVEDHAIVGGVVAIHQFVRVGCYAIIGGQSAIPQDIPPYMTASGNRAKLFGLNLVGLKRHRFVRNYGRQPEAGLPDPLPLPSAFAESDGKSRSGGPGSSGSSTPAGIFERFQEGDLPLRETLGLIAGNGTLPLLVSDGGRKEGYRLAAIGHIGETRKDLKRRVDVLKWVRSGSWRRSSAFSRRRGSKKLFWQERCPKPIFFRASARTPGL